MHYYLNKCPECREVREVGSTPYRDDKGEDIIAEYVVLCFKCTKLQAEKKIAKVGEVRG